MDDTKDIPQSARKQVCFKYLKIFPQQVICI